MLLLALCGAGGAGASERYFRNVAEMGDYGDMTVNCIERDGAGYVWMATDRGVLRCDGVHARLISLVDEARPLYVTSFADLGDGRMAVGTRQGIVTVDRRGAVAGFAGANTEVTSMLLLPGDTLLVGTVHGLRGYDTAGRELEMPGLPVENLYSPGAHVMCMARGGDGSVYVHTLTALYRRDAAGRYEPVMELPLHADRAVGMAVDPDAGTVWVAMMSTGLVAVDAADGTWRRVDVNSPVVTSVSLSADGLYVGTDGNGVYRLELPTGRVVEHIAHEHNRQGAPASNQVYSVATWDDGPLWVGYYQRGVDYSVVNSGLFEVFERPGVLDTRGMAIRTITINDCYKALGTRDGIWVERVGDGRMVNLRRPQLNSDMVIAAHDYRGLLYIGTYGGGMSVYDPMTGELRGFDGGVEWEYPFVRGHVFAIEVDGNDNMWVGTSNGLYRYDGDRPVAHYTDENSCLPAGNVYEVRFDREGRGWVCTENGICVYDPETDTLRDDVLPDDSGLVHDKIRAVFEDSRGRLFFMPERGSIAMAADGGGRVERLDIPALEGADPKAIAEDRDGCIWITTNHGIVRWNGDDEVMRFGVADGLPSAQFILCAPATDTDGSVWFGNSNGLVRLDAARDEQLSTLSGRPVPTAVLADGDAGRVAMIQREDAATYNIRLERFCSNLTVDFSPMTFTMPDAVTYEYSLDDGATWHATDGRMRIEIYNSFTVRHVGLLIRPEGDAGQTTSVEIAMPMSLAMRSVVGLVVVAALLLLYAVYLSMRHLKRRIDERKASAASADGDDEAGSRDGADLPKYRSNPLGEAECVRIMKLVDSVMEKEKLYSDPNLKIGTLAERAGITSHRLSQVFSQHLNMKFYDYVNRYRVKEFKRIASRGGASRYTLTAMAEKAGFSSRASFFRHFKDIEGISPGEFLKAISN